MAWLYVGDRTPSHRKDQLFSGAAKEAAKKKIKPVLPPPKVGLVICDGFLPGRGPA